MLAVLAAALYFPRRPNPPAPAAVEARPKQAPPSGTATLLPAASAGEPRPAAEVPAVKSTPAIAAAVPHEPSRKRPQRASAAASPLVARKEPPRTAVAPTKPDEVKAALSSALPVEKVRLLLVARPRASVEATWPGGSAHTDTPGAVEVPKGARVRLVFTAPGHAPQVEEIEATVPRAVTATLKAAD
jgi:hypothetical protein